MLPKRGFPPLPGMTPPLPAAAGHDAAASRLAGRPAGRLRAAVYRPAAPDLLRHGLLRHSQME